MQGQSGFWTTGFLVAVLLQTIAINAKDATTKKRTTPLRCPLHAEIQEVDVSDLERSETSYFNKFTDHTNLFSNSHPSSLHISTPTITYFPSSSSFPSSIFSVNFGQNASNGVHQQIRCGDTFPQACQHSRYRSYDGSCNNLQNPTWGLANTRYGRLISPRYSDGIRAPTKSITGADLPLARTVSYTMFPNIDINDKIWSLLSMQYGQFITHDMGLIDGTTQSKSHSTRCCTFDGQLVDISRLPRCFPILIPQDDPVYSKTPIQCMNFVRSTTDLDHGCSSPYKPAEQINTVTHYMDLSLVYGSSNQVAANLRAGFGGRLNAELKNNREFPPSARNKTAVCDIVYEFEPCYFAGDSRANQNPQLTVLHIVFVREHNRIADFLAKLNPHWTDETIFQETRRILIAVHQYISYYEWLPIQLGAQQTYNNKITYNTKGYVNDYDETVIANVLNEHSNAAARYFHSNIAGQLSLVSEHRYYYPTSTLRLSDHFNRPAVIEKGNNLDDLTRGLASQPQKKTDIFFDEEITQFLFRRRRLFGSDLRSVDIQRDRDHGLASYNDYREYCGLPRAKTFEDLSDYMNPSDIQKLATLYATPDDIELTVGGSLERHVEGTQAGTTFLCIMMRQFLQTRVGDRYWFETGHPKIAFTLEQLNEIHKASISRLICDNGDEIQHMQRLGFVQVSERNPLVRCDELPQMDLSLWKDFGHDDRQQHITSFIFKKK